MKSTTASMAMFAFAGMVQARTEVSSLDGGMWRLDGEPVAVPHTWNSGDYDKGFADGLGPGDFRRKVDPGNSVMRCANSGMSICSEVNTGSPVCSSGPGCFAGTIDP